MSYFLVCTFGQAMDATDFSCAFPVLVNHAKSIAGFQCHAHTFKIDQNKKSKPFYRLSPEFGKRKKVDMQRLSSRFRSQLFFLWKTCGETLSPNLYCIETPCWCPSRWAPTWRPETSRNIYHWVLLQKREFISRKIQTRDSLYKNCSDSRIPRNKSLFRPTHHDLTPVMWMPRHAKA